MSLMPDPKSEKGGPSYYREYLQENMEAAEHGPLTQSGRTVAILCGLLPPINGFVGILRNALTEIVGESKVERAFGITGQCCLMVPGCGYFPVLLYVLAVQIAITQSVFRCRISIMG